MNRTASPLATTPALALLLLLPPPPPLLLPPLPLRGAHGVVFIAGGATGYGVHCGACAHAGRARRLRSAPGVIPSCVACRPLNPRLCVCCQACGPQVLLA